MAPADPRILVLDSASLYYRSFYALPEKMTAPDGHPHNAVRGFLSTIARLVDVHSPTALVACWDNDWRPAWRVELVPSYKAHRVAEDAGGTAEAEPASLGPQAEGIAEILDAMGLSRWGVDGYEADDVIGSVVTQEAAPSTVVSGDRDLVQLIGPRTRLQLTVNGGMEKWPLLDEAAALERFGVGPDQYVDLAVLRGDPSDGLPGVPGIGGKTAAALVSAFGSLAGVLEAARTLPGQRPMTPRLAAAMLAHDEPIQRARTVATVVRDLELPGPVPDLSARQIDGARLAGLVERWGVARQVDELEAALARQTVEE